VTSRSNLAKGLQSESPRLERIEAHESAICSNSDRHIIIEEIEDRSCGSLGEISEIPSMQEVNVE
jgi:hypothetical protein